MEAHSLASLNLLAANPPQYPENPSETRLEPLVLYISRVPGTRDVILSPFKPQIKNVTGGDVSSSLYYVHLEIPMLDITGPQPLRDDAQGRSSEDSSMTRTIARKPVPGSISSQTPNISIQGDQQPQQQQQQQQQQPQITFGNPTLRPPNDLSAPFNSQDAEVAPPLPPRQYEWSGSTFSENPSQRNAPDGSQQLRPSASRRKPVGPRQLSDIPQSRVSMDETARSRDQTRDRSATMGHTRQSRSLSPIKNSEYSTPPFTLSLIRRDPGTGDQWNVGKISSYEVNNEVGETGQSATYLSASSEQRSPQHPPIDIHIESAGYAKFRGRPSSAIPPRRSMDADRSFMDMAPGPRADGMFSRQVSMAYSRSFGSAIRSKFHQMEQAARKKAAHNRSESEASANSFSSGEYKSGSPTSSRPDKMKPRGYTFTSPWGGRCEFRTGNGGRSLLCHHFLHEGEVGAYNPLVPEASPSRSSTVVSELRFNLPGSEFFPSGEVPKGDDRRLGHFSKFIKSAMERYEDRDEDDVISPFDVNIGGERAGGGNRGKRAKLGKLIIYHDGLKMLDLLVAANMGLWWGTWERSF